MEKKQRFGKYILFASVFVLLMLNWNSYSIYTRVQAKNAFAASVVLVILLILSVEIKDLIKDKLLYVIAGINLIALINMTILKTGYLAMFPLFVLTMALYIFEKIEFSKNEILITSAVLGFFYFYWTFDVKGYFKGYSINYGGLVLIGGFVFVIFLLEYLRFLTKSYNGDNKIICFLKKYPYIFTAVEIVMFLWGYNIISWYRSRTAFFALIAFAVFLVIPRKIFSNKLLFPLIVIGVIAGGFLFPVIYVYVGNRVNPVDYQTFYKTLFDDRLPVWQDLYHIYQNFRVTGVGTIITNNDLYRPGLLDTMNAYLDLLFVYGPVVCTGTVVLLGGKLLGLRKKVEENHFSKLAMASALTIMIASYGESMLLIVPFTFMFMAALIYICNAEKLADSQYVAVDVKRYKKMLAGPFKDKLLATCLCVGLPVFLLLVLGPVEIYYSNYDEFSFTNMDYLFIYGAMAVIAFFVLSTVISLIPDKVHKPVCVGFLAVSVASYVQYMFLNKKLIMEDGEFIEAQDLGNYPAVTLGIYIAVMILVVVIAIIFRKKLYTYVQALSGLILIMTVIAVFSLFVSHIGRNKTNMWYGGSDQFKVAKGDNVIVIVPDTFGRWALDEMLKMYPDGIDFLNDFTYYDKEDSLYYPTYPALHHMLTAVPYDGTMTRYEWTKYALEQDSTKNFFKALHDKDYTVRLYTRDIFFEDLTEEMVDNVEEAHITIDRKALTKFLFRMSMYRYVPYVMKAPFQVSTLDIDNINVYNGVGPHWLNSDFYPAMHQEKVTVDDSINNAFIMHHIRGAHMPYMSNINNELVPDNSVLGEETAYGTMLLIRDYLEYLKEIDKYDDSTIIIVGDHGFNETDAIYFQKNKDEKHDELAVNHEEITHTGFQERVLSIIK